MLILVIVAILGLIGWYIFQARRNNNSLQTTVQAQTKKPVSHAFVSANVMAPYVLPDGWSSLNCGTDTVYLFVPSEKASTTCSDSHNQPENPNSPDFALMGTYSRDTSYLDTQSCANTLKIRNGGTSPYPANEYACQDVTISGKKGLRQVGTHTVKSAQVSGVPSVEIIYDFPAANGLMFEASYTHYTSSPYPDFTKRFDAFVHSLKFM